MIGKTTFTELNKEGKTQIVLFGSGNIAKKTIRKIGPSNIKYIVDNSLNLQGQKYEGKEILSPNVLTKDDFVLICSTAITDISKQLSAYGLIENSNYALSPILNDLIAISDLEQIETSFHFTSGTVPNKGDVYGGGLYKCEVKGEETILHKLYSGPCYGAIQVGNDILFVDTDSGLFKLSSEKVSLVCELPKGSRAHGISYNPSNGKYYISCSYLDGILELDGNFKIERTFKISDRLDTLGEPMHHCNDNLAIGNKLFVSMFSSTGNWKNDVFDGCIAEFDITTGQRLRDVTSGLYMPHNVKYFDGSIHVLDSLPGHLRFNNLSIQGTFPAFTRGLDYKNGLYYVGQSKNRNYSKVMGVSNNISIDCGVILFNSELKASRFLQFPHAIGEIHAIVA